MTTGTVVRGTRAGWRPLGAGAGAVVLVLATAVAAAALSIVIALPLQGPVDGFLDRLEQACYVGGFAVLAVTGAVLLHRRPDDRMGWLLAAAGLAQLVTILTMGYAALAVSSERPLPDPLLWSTNWLWVPAQTAALLVLLRFPHGRRLPSPRWRAVEAAILLWAAVTMTVTALLPGPVGAATLDHLDNPYGWSAMGGLLDAAVGPLFLVLPLLTIAAASALIWRWRGATAQDRQRLRWVAAAAVLTIVAAPLVLLGTDSADAPLALALVILPSAIAVAVLRSRLWELGVVARSVTATGVCAVLLLAAYATVVRSSSNAYLPAVAGLAVAAVAIPAHRLVRRGLDRFLLGTQGDPDAVARDLRLQLRTSPRDALGQAATRLADTLRLPWVTFEGADGAALATSAGRRDAERCAHTVVPMLVAGDEVGRLVTVERAAGEGLSPRDLRILRDVAQTCALVVHAVRVDGELTVSRERLGTVRHEERARLQRDLHDGLGPVLGGIAMHAEAARNLVSAGSGPDSILAQLDHVDAGAEGAVAEVRRLVHELRPTGLGEVGLTEALHRAVRGVAEHLTVTAEIDLPADLDSATEVAVYRIVVEAVRNAARHADADRVAVTARAEGAEIVLSVVDNGRGLAESRPGVGVRTMRERAAELGGSVSLSDDPQGGCRLLARLPAVAGAPR